MDAWLVIPAAVATWREGDRLDTNVGRILCLELDPVAVEVNGLVVVGLRDEKRHHPSATGRSESNGRERSDHGDTHDRSEQMSVLPFHPWHNLAPLPVA